MTLSALRWLLISAMLLTATWTLAGIFAPPAQPQEDPASPAEMKPYVDTIPGTNISFAMVPIPGGTFLMGSPRSEAHRSDDEGPQHPVTIRPFWMGKSEVTWEEYDLFAFSMDIRRKDRQGVDLGQQSESEKQADAISRPTPPYADETFGYGRGGLPVISITHHAAMEYCRWLSNKTGKTYRLPTEAEWEYACRAGTTTRYHFGDKAARLGEHAWFLDNSEDRPHRVAAKKPNPWGLYDMHGNVAEWCLDHYDKDFYKTFDLRTPALVPVLLPTREKYPHVVRGGSWDDEAPRLRSAARHPSEENWSMRDPQIPQSIWWHTEAIFVGFRIVRPLQEQENLRGLRSKVKKFHY